MPFAMPRMRVRTAVCVVFDGRVIAGTRARKMRTKSMNAFQSVDYPELACVRDGRVLRYFYEPEMQPRPTFTARSTNACLT